MNVSGKSLVFKGFIYILYKAIFHDRTTLLEIQFMINPLKGVLV